MKKSETDKKVNKEIEFLEEKEVFEMKNSIKQIKA